MSHLGEFDKQWQEFKKCMETTGKHLESAELEFQKLTTTRARMLERSLKHISELRLQQGIVLEPLVGSAAEFSGDGDRPV